MNKTTKIFGAFLCTALVSGIATATPTQYTITVVPSIDGTTAMIPTALNNLGQVVGYAYLAAGDRQAFAATSLGGALIPTLGGTRSSASGINDSGQIAGWSATGTAAEYRPFLYSQLSGIINLGTLGGRSSIASGINSSGLVVGNSSTSLPYDSQYAAFTVQPGGQPVRIDLSPQQARDSFAYGINDNGDVTGSIYSQNNSESYAFLNSYASTALLPGLGGSHATGMAVNNTGQVAGSAALVNGDQRAFLFDGAQTINLGTISDQDNLGYGLGTAAWSGSNAINNRGQVVGTFGFVGYQGRGFISDGNGMSDLNDLLGPDAIGVWEITDAMAINDAGVIAAYGYRIGEYVGTTLFLTPVPESPTFALILLGLVAIVVRRRMTTSEWG